MTYPDSVIHEPKIPQLGQLGSYAGCDDGYVHPFIDAMTHDTQSCERVAQPCERHKSGKFIHAAGVGHMVL